MRMGMSFALPFIILLLFLLFGGCATTVPATPQAWSLIEPPARFDHKYPYTHNVYYVPIEETWERCKGIGCSYVHPYNCVSYIATDSVIPVPMILQHETGHCNGWTAAHEDGHLVPAN